MLALIYLADVGEKFSSKFDIMFAIMTAIVGILSLIAVIYSLSMGDDSNNTNDTEKYDSFEDYKIKQAIKQEQIAKDNDSDTGFFHFYKTCLIVYTVMLGLWLFMSLLPSKTFAYTYAGVELSKSVIESERNNSLLDKSYKVLELKLDQYLKEVTNEQKPDR